MRPRFNGPKFILLLSVWVLPFGSVFVLFYLNDHQQEALFINIHKAAFLLLKVGSMARFMDDWNNITLVTLLCVFTIVLCVNEIFIRRLFPDSDQTSSSYFVTGLIWFAKLSANIFLLGFEITLVCYLINLSVSAPSLTSAEEVPNGKYTILLLGTSKKLKNTGNPNLYYEFRLQTTIQLYNAGKIKRLVISGDHTGEYNEPVDMMNDLKRLGMKGVEVVLDGRGFRTFDSILRTKQMAGDDGKPIIIISQLFHLERALFLARRANIEALGVAANGNMTKEMFKREWFAKTKVLMDIYILNTQSPGVAASPRRQINPLRPGHCAILLTVLGLIAVSGRLMRQLLTF